MAVHRFYFCSIMVVHCFYFCSIMACWILFYSGSARDVQVCLGKKSSAEKAVGGAKNGGSGLEKVLPEKWFEKETKLLWRSFITKREGNPSLVFATDFYSHSFAFIVALLSFWLPYFGSRLFWKYVTHFLVPNDASKVARTFYLPG